jgi:hypothetical protein
MLLTTLRAYLEPRRVTTLFALEHLSAVQVLDFNNCSYSGLDLIDRRQRTRRLASLPRDREDECQEQGNLGMFP